MRLNIDLRDATPEQCERFVAPHLPETLTALRQAVADPTAIIWVQGFREAEGFHVVQTLADFSKPLRL